MRERERERERFLVEKFISFPISNGFVLFFFSFLLETKETMVVLKERNGTREAGDALMSPLKSPLKSRKSLKGLLSPNDDAKERKTTRAKQKELKARRRSLNLTAEDFDAEEEKKETTTKTRTSKKEKIQRRGGEGSGQKASVAELQELYQNCIKLSSENKISSKNTWDLNLIEHLSELVKPENKQLTSQAQGGDASTDADLNFQKASCTLDAGVKIYSYRVDSIHTDAFKVLGGLHRTSNEQEEEGGANGECLEDGTGEKKSRRSRKVVDVDPSSTLEQNQEALNVKKFDLSFTVDPLFHQTSMKFDEGGAKGLLLNHLHVTQGCELVFDSCDNRYNRYVRNEEEDLPENDTCIEDLDSISDKLEKVKNCNALRLTTSTRVLENALNPQLQADENALSNQVQRWLTADPSDSLDESLLENENEMENEEDPCVSDSLGPWMDSSMGDMESDGEEVNNSDESIFRSTAAGDDGGTAVAGGLVPGDGPSTDWLSQIGMSTQFNKSSWAGMSHWRYRGAPAKPKASEVDESANENKKKSTRRKPQMIDFENLPPLPKEPFRSAKNEKEISLKGDPNNALIEFFPEDVHYEVSNLGKLFFKPFTNLRQMHLRRNESHEGEDDYEDYDDEGGFDAAASFGFGDDIEEGDEAPFDSNGLSALSLDAPRMVEQIDINYDKTSKQVDVKKLKEALWVSLQKKNGADDADKLDESTYDFQGVLDTMGDSAVAAGKKDDISVHLCFICLLHLANENTLKIEDCPSMDKLLIQQD